jgi:hypothetical protein
VTGVDDSNHKEIAVCTVATKNNLAFVRVFTDSFAKHNPGIDIFILLVDKINGYFQPELEKYKIVTVEELRNEEIPGMLFRYNALEACTALKPYFLQYLLQKYRLSKIAYFDTDILITSNLNDLWQILEEHSIVLTPHLTEPIPTSDHYRPGEFEIMKSGTFNLGFMALRNTPDSIRFLDWWRERLSLYCIYDPNNGYFADQKWIDLAPGYFENIYTLRDPRYNAAFWNLQSRPIQIVGDQVLLGDKPLKFFHFSGFNPENINQISKHQNRFVLNQLPEIKPLFEQYRDLLFARGYSISKHWPYSFAFFDNGIGFPDIARKIYLGLGEKAARFGDPFAAEKPSSFFQWLNESVDGQEDHSISRLWHAIYLSRPDLQSSFPDVFAKNRQQFLDWIANFGIREYNIDRGFVERSGTDKFGTNTKHAHQKSLRFLGLRLWLWFKARGRNMAIRLFGRNPRLFKGLLLISKGIETMLLPDHAVVGVTSVQITPTSCEMVASCLEDKRHNSDSENISASSGKSKPTPEQK